MGQHVEELDRLLQSGEFDDVAFDAGHVQGLLAHPGGVTALLRQDPGQECGVGGGHTVDTAASGEFLHRRVRDQPAAADHQDTVRGLRHLRQQVGGDQDRTPLVRELAEQGAQPADALRVESVEGLVQDQGPGVAEQGRRQPESLPHPQGETTGALAPDPGQTDLVQDRVDAGPRDGMCQGHGPQMGPRAASRVEEFRIQQRPRRPERGGVLGEQAPADQGPAAGGAIQPHQYTHRGGLACPVGSEEACHEPRPYCEVQILDGRHVTVGLGQAFDLHHHVSRFLLAPTALSCPRALRWVRAGRPAPPGRVLLSRR